MQEAVRPRSRTVARHLDVASSPLPGTGRRIVLSQQGRLRVMDGGAELGRCKLRSRTGEFEFVAPAPDASLAVARWSDQTEVGLVLAGLADTPRQLDAAWETRETNWLEGPVWTPDSRALVLIENPAGAGPWWAGPEGDDDDVSPGGAFSPGSVVVLERDLRERFRRRVEVELPRGWSPGGDVDRGLGVPTELAPDAAVVRVPVLGEQVVSFA
jgi:hypothetical protein